MPTIAFSIHPACINGLMALYMPKLGPQMIRPDITPRHALARALQRPIEKNKLQNQDKQGENI
jgi:hypothetical protein